MIRTKNHEANFLTEFTDGAHTALTDAPADKGGAGEHISPFGLLEAALATCLNITLRFYAEAHGIALDKVETVVTLKQDSDGSTFEYWVDLPEDLPEDQKKRLFAALRGCPVHGLLSKPIQLELKAPSE
ncbi:OsmC family protein [Pseudodesulfovibrio cashew]|nr:OsmC family protein [Pseudodesulfovibrio cashew]